MTPISIGDVSVTASDAELTEMNCEMGPARAHAGRTNMNTRLSNGVAKPLNTGQRRETTDKSRHVLRVELERQLSIAVIIVNYETAELAVDAVESVLSRRHGEQKIDLHLVDNASSDSDRKILTDAHAERGWGTDVTLWLEKVNHGFARGNNLVLKFLASQPAPPDYIFLLNPDARLANEAINVLFNAIQSNDRAIAAGAGISLPDGTPVSASFRFPSLAREIVETINFGPLDRIFPNNRVALQPDHAEGSVDWVAGAAVLFRFRELCESGFFDPDFFLYFEEVELMKRLTRNGGRILFVPSARIVHAEGAATNLRTGTVRRQRQPAYLYQSWRMYYLKAHGRPYATVTALLKVAAAWLNVAIFRIRGRQPSIPKSFFHDHFRYVIYPLILSSKP